MRRKNKLPKKIASMLAVAIVVVACAGGEETTQSEEADELASAEDGSETDSENDVSEAGDENSAGPARLIVARTQDAATLDPVRDASGGSVDAFRQLYDTLVAIDRDGDVVPSVAESFTSNDAGDVWTFQIRPGVIFHDGSELTAEDVKFSMDVILEDDSSPQYQYASLIQSVEVIDGDSVEITLDGPSAVFARNLVHIRLLPADSYDPDTFAEQPIGSGPFSIESWNRDEQLVFAAHDDYWDGRVEIDELVFSVVPNTSSALAALESGDVDVVLNVEPPDVPRLEEADGINVVPYETNRVAYLGMNVNNPPFDDVQFRRAIEMAIDREAIVDQLLDGLGIPNNQPFAPATWGYNDAIEVPEYDPQGAMDLLDEAGLSGATIQFDYPNDFFAFGNEVGEAVAGYLEAVGLSVSVQTEPYSSFRDRWFNAPEQLPGLWMSTFGPSSMDAGTPLNTLYRNQASWQDDEVLELVNLQNVTPDLDARQDLVDQIIELQLDQLPYVWLYTEIQVAAMADHVDWQPRPDGNLFMTSATLR